jgi:hypothetical protein
MRDNAEQRAKEFYPDTVSSSQRPRRGNPFFGDTGTVFSEQARKDLEDNSPHGDEGAGHPGNNVDFSQRYAQSEADEYTEQAERMTRAMERSDAFKYSGQFADPEKRREFVEGLAERLRGKPAMPAQPQEPEEEEALSRSADNKFWSNPEELKRAGKMVRPEKL